ncbi:hypothetical protein EVAR_75181_1 [Eumeta japonica]|uniref:Uncharacterized protein n=1 Tax=Eumeta variegata TaxID=151549 RepID=A0A4C1U0Z5_EUMVA|nr:hypothetical protein EVAR_75181_1 [Eumeta japonica]
MGQTDNEIPKDRKRKQRSVGEDLNDLMRKRPRLVCSEQSFYRCQYSKRLNIGFSGPLMLHHDASAHSALKTEDFLNRHTTSCMTSNLQFRFGIV